MKRARDAAGIGVLRSGVAQLGSQPLSKWYGTTMPPGSRIRFADPSFGPRALGGQGSPGGQGSLGTRLGAPGDTRFPRAVRPKARNSTPGMPHAPVGKTVRTFYHVNQKG